MISPQNRVKAYFLNGGRLTVLKALRKFDTTELRSIVSRLRNDEKTPINIQSQKISVHTSDGREIEVKEYYCPDAKPSFWFRITDNIRQASGRL